MRALTHLDTLASDSKGGAWQLVQEGTSCGTYAWDLGDAFTIVLDNVRDLSNVLHVAVSTLVHAVAIIGMLSLQFAFVVLHIPLRQVDQIIVPLVLVVWKRRHLGFQ